MRILLTGHKGFIGKNIYKTLLKNGDSVEGIEKEQVSNLLSNIEKLHEIVKKCDVILHVGAISDTSLQDYNTMLYYNYHFTKHLVNSAKKYNKKIIYSSSASVYGGGDTTDTPNNIYAWSKLLGEEYGRLVYPTGFTSLRYFNVYGPYEDYKGKMSSIHYQAWKYYTNNPSVPFKLFPKNPKRDFIYVKDVVSANITAINQPTNIYDVGTGEARGFEDILFNLNYSYEYTSPEIIPTWYQYYTQADKNNFVPGWTPKYNLENGIKDYLIYLEEKIKV